LQLNIINLDMSRFLVIMLSGDTFFFMIAVVAALCNRTEILLFRPVNMTCRFGFNWYGRNIANRLGDQLIIRFTTLNSPSCITYQKLAQ